MRKQWTMIFASFVLMVAFSTATMAQGRPTSGGTVSSACKTNEDGKGKCGSELPPIRPPTGVSTATSGSTASTSGWLVFWNWLTSF